MKTDKLHEKGTALAVAAFSLIEAIIGAAVVGIVALALCTGITQGFAVIRQIRESLRATQVLQEKLEVIRLYTWDQINSNGFVPATFTVPIYSGRPDPVYQGTLSVATAPIAEPYSNDLRLVTVQVIWTNGGHRFTRSMSSYVARYGLQSYIY